MAERTITLRMSVAEERALARLIGYLCKAQRDRGELGSILGESNSDIGLIGSINAALNAAR